MLRTCLILALLAPAGAAFAGKKPAKRTPVGTPAEVSGYGADPAEARNNAVANAVEEARKLAGVRALSAELVERLGVLEVGEAVPSAVLRGQELMEVRAKVGLTRELIAAAEAADRAETAGRRQGLLGRVVAAFVVAFALAAGYLRLEEWTKGYATRLLRLVAGLIALLAALGLWLVG
ncbi:MAG: hypothetical protein ACRC33_29755 [Gemmataceae bacterium]